MAEETKRMYKIGSKHQKGNSWSRKPVQKRYEQQSQKKDNTIDRIWMERRRY
jgi:hypothetical protein